MPRIPIGQRILGIDPGLNITGYGVVDFTASGVRLVEAGIVRSRERGSLAGRLREIHAGVSDVLKSFSPVAVAIEELYSHYSAPGRQS